MGDRLLGDGSTTALGPPVHPLARAAFEQMQRLAKKLGGTVSGSGPLTPGSSVMQVAGLYGERGANGRVTFSVRILTTGGHPNWSVTVYAHARPCDWTRVQKAVGALLRAIAKAGVVDGARWEPSCAP